MHLPRLAVALLTLALALPIAATTIHDESADGDLSTDPANPTPLAFGLGSNVVIGTMQSPGDTRDYFTFTLGSGESLTNLFLSDYTDVNSGGPGNTGYTAINAGSTSSVPSGSNSGDFLGGNHVSGLDEGTDLLPGLAAATLAGTGFSVPLGAGTYTFLIQQTGPPLTGYTLDFVVVPEPGTAALSILGLAALGAARRRASAARSV